MKDNALAYLSIPAPEYPEKLDRDYFLRIAEIVKLHEGVFIPDLANSDHRSWNFKYVAGADLEDSEYLTITEDGRLFTLGYYKDSISRLRGQTMADFKVMLDEFIRSQGYIIIGAKPVWVNLLGMNGEVVDVFKSGESLMIDGVEGTFKIYNGPVPKKHLKKPHATKVPTPKSTVPKLEKPKRATKSTKSTKGQK